MITRFKFQNVESVGKIRTSIVDLLASELNISSAQLDLHQLHKLVKPSKINELRMKAISCINKQNWTEILFENCFEEIKQLLGPDLLIQKKLNMSIQMPNDEDSVLEAHSDCSSGDSPFELVIWIPLTKCFSTNSMFIQSREKSKIFYESLKSNTPVETEVDESDFLYTDWGECIVFPPTLIHGNVINKTNSTRMSINVRIKSIFSPYTKTLVHDRMYGTYYKVFKTSELTKWNMEVHENLS